MLKNSGTAALKWRLSWLNYSELHTGIKIIVTAMRIKDWVSTNLNQAYKRFVPTFYGPVYIRWGGYFSPLCTAPITITTKII
jgi:hypothetical protein